MNRERAWVGAVPWAGLASFGTGALAPLSLLLVLSADPASGLAVLTAIDIGSGKDPVVLRCLALLMLAAGAWAMITIRRSRWLPLHWQIGCLGLGFACMSLWNLVALTWFGIEMRAALW